MVRSIISSTSIFGTCLSKWFLTFKLLLKLPAFPFKLKSWPIYIGLLFNFSSVSGVVSSLSVLSNFILMFLLLDLLLLFAVRQLLYALFFIADCYRLLLFIFDPLLLVDVVWKDLPVSLINYRTLGWTFGTYGSLTVDLFSIVVSVLM